MWTGGLNDKVILIYLEKRFYETYTPVLCIFCNILQYITECQCLPTDHSISTFNLKSIMKKTMMLWFSQNSEKHQLEKHLQLSVIL